MLRRHVRLFLYRTPRATEAALPRQAAVPPLNIGRDGHVKLPIAIVGPELEVDRILVDQPEVVTPRPARTS